MTKERTPAQRNGTSHGTLIHVWKIEDPRRENIDVFLFLYEDGYLYAQAFHGKVMWVTPLV